MKRGIILGSAAVASVVGSFTFPAGAYNPVALVGQPLDNAFEPQPASTSTDPATRTLVGKLVNTRYGPVQLQINVTGTTIDSVDMLQVPTGENARFTNYAVPILMRETVEAQSANISVVSGASYTSMGFIESLQSAISQL